jgi:hypothetical protein
MFALSSAHHRPAASSMVRVRDARHCRRAAATVRVSVGGSSSEESVLYTFEELAADSAPISVATPAASTTAAPAAFATSAAAQPKVQAQSNVKPSASATQSKPAPAVSADLQAANAEWAARAARPVAQTTAFSTAATAARIDPADGSIAEAAPYGDDLSGLTNALVAFKEPRAVETINGRVAMIGWMLALQGEFTSDQSLFRQVINTRTFTLADGVEKSSTFPAGGAFLIPLTVLFVLAASLAPILRGNDESGLEKAPKDFFMFKASSEMTNGRAAMVGLASLLFVEKFTNGAALF